MPNQNTQPTTVVILNAGGKVLLRNGKFIYSVKAFKKAFKVGDLIRYGVCGGTGRITAIGDKRFLYRITHSNRVDERVGTIRSMTGWGKP